MTKTTERWPSEDKRCDGLVIMPGVDGFVIMPGNESPPIDVCPTCQTALRTARKARLVADMVLPLTS